MRSQEHDKQDKNQNSKSIHEQPAATQFYATLPGFVSPGTAILPAAQSTQLVTGWESNWLRPQSTATVLTGSDIPHRK